MDDHDQIGGAVLSAILEKDEPCSIRELQAISGMRNTSENKLIEILSSLVEIGVICRLQGELYIDADKAGRYAESENRRPTQRRSEPLPHREVPPMESTVGTRRSAPFPSNHSTGTNLTGQQGAMALHQQAVVQRSQHNQVATTQSYDSDVAQTQQNLDKFQRILSVFTPEVVALRGHEIAKRSGLGTSRGDVNRHLYALKERNILRNDNNTWSLVKNCSVEELTVCASTLAGKKGTKSSTGQTSSSGSTPQDCPCPNAGPNCQHNHFHQTNHYHEYNVQVGDGNQLYFDKGNQENQKS